ncbi:MAG TPA: Gfo/Idh/MocA family oxidoreductase [Gemmatimonadaceae bacterium]|nr:Gfo/Idh/MocA family oxidoreductase [Gemmatimonadaceae bacterium]
MRGSGTGAAQLRLGIVGCGRVVERLHLPALRSCDAWQISAVAEPLGERRAWIGSALPGVRVTDTLPELLAGGDVDAVLIAAPPVTHCALALEALSRGVAVLVEKPMALLVSDARAMRDASRQVRRPLWVGFNRRFRTSYRAMRDLLRGERARRCDITFVLSAGSGTWSSVTDFQGSDSAGGGVLDDLASHQLDLLPWLLNDRRKHVQARHLRVRTPTSAFAITVTFEGGTTAKCIAKSGPHYREQLVVRIGERRFLADPAGTWDVSGLTPGLATWLADRRTMAASLWRKARRRPSGSVESIRRQWEAFAAVVTGTNEPHDGADAEDGLRCVEAVAECREHLGSVTGSLDLGVVS